MSLPASALRRIATLCRSSTTRIVGEWEDGDPSRWEPYAVHDPRYDELFTDAAAWDYIAELVELGDGLRQVALREPKGCVGYELIHVLSDKRVLYIKFRLAGGIVIGRSFHYSRN